MPTLAPAATRLETTDECTERAPKSRSSSRKIGIRKSTGVTAVFQKSGDLLKAWYAQCPKAMQVYAPCGCQTTRCCFVGSIGGSGSRTLLSGEPE